MRKLLLIDLFAALLWVEEKFGERETENFQLHDGSAYKLHEIQQRKVKQTTQYICFSI